MSRFPSFKKKFTWVRIAGLVCGLVIFLSILLYINYEEAFDNWDPVLKNVYQVAMSGHAGKASPVTPSPLSQFILENDPGAVNATRVQLAAKGEPETLLVFGEKMLYTSDVLRVDSNFLSLFPFQLEYGNRARALASPNTIVLTRDLSARLFGDVDPIGKTIWLDKSNPYVVSGVIDDERYPSHIHFAALIPLKLGSATTSSWINFRYKTYVLFKPGIPAEKIARSARDQLTNRLKAVKPLTGQDIAISLIPVKKVHLFNAAEGGGGEFQTLVVFALLALLVLVVSGMSYINLTIASLVARHKEIYVRRVSGASSRHIFVQILAESFLHILVSVLLAFLFLLPAIRWLDRLLNAHLLDWNVTNPGQLGIELCGLVVVLILLSGGYPALVFARYKPSQLYRFDSSAGSQRAVLRKVLLGVQFTISIFFMTVSLVIYSQMNYLDRLNKGFVPNQVIRLQSSFGIFSNYSTFRKELLRYPSIKNVTRCSNYPGDGLSLPRLPFGYKGSSYDLDLVSVDLDFFKTLSIGLVDGRDFNGSYALDSTKSIIINAAAARTLGISTLTGQLLASPCQGDSGSRVKNIVGIINDYNTEGFEKNIRPTVYSINSPCTNFMISILVKVSADDLQTTLNYISGTWNKFDNSYPIRYSFLDEVFAKSLLGYQRMEKMVFLSAISLIIISLIGIFALATFELDQRWKELSIRKVLGASFFDLFKHVNGRLLTILATANLIALPLAYYYTHSWLAAFAYRINTPYGLYVLTAILNIVTALVISNIRIARIITLIPVEKLKLDH